MQLKRFFSFNVGARSSVPWLSSFSSPLSPAPYSSARFYVPSFTSKSPRTRHVNLFEQHVCRCLCAFRCYFCALIINIKTLDILRLEFAKSRIGIY